MSKEGAYFRPFTRNVLYPPYCHQINNLRRGEELTHVVLAIPTCNNEKYLGTLLLKARRTFSDIIVVDDASEDDTVRIANAACVDIVRHPVSLGRNAVYRSILRAAREKDPDALVVLNGSGYRDPDEISHVLDPVLEGEAEIAECPGTGFAAYSRSVLHGLMVREERIYVDESLVDHEPTVKILENEREEESHEEAIVKPQAGG